jgi:hypothetical protein
VTRWYSLFGLFWFAQFCTGCQHMIIAGAVAKWFFTRYMQSLLERYNLWRWLACCILCIILLVGCWWISGEFSSRVALDRLHQQYSCSRQASLQLDCFGEALSAVRLQWTGFISSGVAFYRLYQQYGCSWQALSAVGLLLTGFISSRVLWAGFITSKCAMDRFYTTALHSA